MKKLLSQFMFLLFILLLNSCTQEKKEKVETVPIGKYVFVDDAGITHINENCSKLKYGKDKHGHSIFAKEPIDTNAFIFRGYERVCSWCVNISDYEYLKAICVRNIERDRSRKWLYEHFCNNEYDMGDYNVFLIDLSNPLKRKKLFDAACGEGWNVGSYEEFSRILGF